MDCPQSEQISRFSFLGPLNFLVFAAISFSIALTTPSISRAQSADILHLKRKAAAARKFASLKAHKHLDKSKVDNLEEISFESRPAFRDGWGSLQRNVTSKHRLPMEQKNSGFSFGFSNNDNNKLLSGTRLESAPQLSALVMSPGIFPPVSSDIKVRSEKPVQHANLPQTIEGAYETLKRESSRLVARVIESTQTFAADYSDTNVVDEVVVSPYDDLRKAIQEISPHTQARNTQYW